MESGGEEQHPCAPSLDLADSVCTSAHGSRLASPAFENATEFPDGDQGSILGGGDHLQGVSFAHSGLRPVKSESAASDQTNYLAHTSVKAEPIFEDEDSLSMDLRHFVFAHTSTATGHASEEELAAACDPFEDSTPFEQLAPIEPLEFDQLNSSRLLDLPSELLPSM
jgi:hypothetical protein